MKNKILCLFSAVVLLLTPSLALARQYIIPDSDTRELTAEELRDWSFESLDYILNEIFARHGFAFDRGSDYDDYFASLPWYTRNANTDNQTMVYDKLSPEEWQNERLVKDILAEMRDAEDYNTEGLNYRDYISFNKMYANELFFTGRSFVNGQTLAVYSAPDTSSYRGANGKARVVTDDTIYVAGWEGKWLMVLYRTSGNAVRVGYVPKSAFRDSIDAPELAFDNTPITCSRNVYLTDDPVTGATSIVKLEKGEQVTFLAAYYCKEGWAYVETQVGGKTVRGFIPESAVDAMP